VAASIIDFFTRAWVASSRTGGWVAVSLLLKFDLALIGLYAMLTQFGLLPSESTGLRVRDKVT
jgi:hypothetical protein